MINSISLNNIVICKDSTINLAPNFTALTGETGAGKSIIIDALEMALGKKARYDLIMDGADKLSVVVSFDISNNKDAIELLKEQEIDASNELIIKRVLRREKKSIALVQGERVPLTFLSKLGALLVNIHDQNSHIRLSNREHNLKMFDKAISADLLQNVEKAYLDVSEVKSEIELAEEEIRLRKQSMELNKYYKAELDELNPSETEYNTLVEAKKEFSFKESNAEYLSKAISVLEGEYSITSALDSVVSSLSAIKGLDDTLNPIISMISESSINISEAQNDLSRLEFSNDDVNVDELVERIDLYQKLASKHGCEPSELVSVLDELTAKTDSFEEDEAKLESLNLNLVKLSAIYNQHSEILHEARNDLASRVSSDISEMLPKLKLEHAKFKLEYLKTERVSRFGNSDCNLLFSANKSGSMGELATVASGGELSRIALCIQVCLSRLSRLPTLIFDEVDVGISGTAALVVGEIFREIGRTSQIVTITHQSQVAAAANSHILVEKTHDAEGTYNQIRHLNEDEVVKEVNRLLVGFESEESANLAQDLINKFKDESKR